MQNYKKRKQILGVPDRWLPCPNIGGIINDIFVPFKTPLDSKYDEYVPETDRFYPKQLIEGIKKIYKKKKIGLWIDLTNTNRFYDEADVSSKRLRYKKIPCAGHTNCPTLDQVSEFINTVKEYETNNKKRRLIGVHCTHGFNRTGFMIVSYLITECAWQSEVAIQAFAESRQPGIYKQDYLKELNKRYGGEEMGAPPRPNWCFVENQQPEDPSFSQDAKRRRIQNQPTPSFMKGISGVEPLTDIEEITSIQKKVQKMCNWERDTFPGTQPVSMDRENIMLLNKSPYKVSWKADGTRYMMLIDGPDRVFFIDRNNAIFKVSTLQFRCRKDVNQHIADTLVDGEMVIDKVYGEDIPRYLIYDIIKFQTEDVGATKYETRETCISKELIGPRSALITSGKIDKTKEPFSVRRKDFWDISYTNSLFKESFSQTLSHELDGLIFQPTNECYKGGTCQSILKWKPPYLNSIDFRLVIRKVKGRIGELARNEGQLYVTGSKNPYASIVITEEIKHLHGKIIECRFDGTQWKFMRERTDKNCPNYIKTAEAIIKSIREPITKDNLLAFIASHRYIPPK